MSLQQTSTVPSMAPSGPSMAPTASPTSSPTSFNRTLFYCFLPLIILFFGFLLIRISDHLKNRRRKIEAEAERRNENERAAALAAAAEALVQERNKMAAATTISIVDDFEVLHSTYPTALAYEKVTVNAKAALLAGDLVQAAMFAEQRDDLDYTPPSTVDDMLDNLLELKRRLLVRKMEHEIDTNSALSIERAEICKLFIGQIQGLIGSRIEASELKIIPWTELSPCGDQSKSLLGAGQFGTVYKLRWSTHLVAVKVVALSECRIKDKNYDFELLRSIQEAERVVEMTKRGGVGMADLISQVYGFVEGPVVGNLASSLNLQGDEEAFGIVMRLEGGGTLRDRLYAAPGKPPLPLSTTEKLRFIQQSARALFELHRIGVIHGDLKPANVLLSDKNPPDCRLADFGLSLLREEEQAKTRMKASTIQLTGVAQGTPFYSAPEMLKFAENGVSVKASRATDIYALGIMMHEVLSRQVPFSDMGFTQVGPRFIKAIGDGVRPPLDKLPNDTPPAVRALVQKCWDGDRALRPSAAEAMAIVTHALSVLESEKFDIFLSYCHTKKAFAVHLFKVLTTVGFRIWLDQNNMGHNMVSSMQKGIEKSAVTLALVDQAYQRSPNCLAEIQQARNVAKKPVLVVIVETNFWSWSTPDFKGLTSGTFRRRRADSRVRSIA